LPPEKYGPVVQGKAGSCDGTAFSKRVRVFRVVSVRFW
jgi:hypothetical protein